MKQSAVFLLLRFTRCCEDWRHS